MLILYECRSTQWVVWSRIQTKVELKKFQLLEEWQQSCQHYWHWSNQDWSRVWVSSCSRGGLRNHGILLVTSKQRRWRQELSWISYSSLLQKHISMLVMVTLGPCSRLERSMLTQSSLWSAQAYTSLPTWFSSLSQPCRPIISVTFSPVSVSNLHTSFLWV